MKWPWEGLPCITRSPEDKNLSLGGVRTLLGQVEGRAGLLYSRLPSEDQVSSLQAELRTIIGRLADKQGVVFFMPAIARVVLPWPKVEELPEYTQTVVMADSPEDLFRLAAQEHLIPVMTNVFRCPECQRIFLRGRKDQGFCSKTCQVRVGVRRLRNTPPDRIGKRGRPLGSSNKNITRKAPPKRSK